MTLAMPQIPGASRLSRAVPYPAPASALVVAGNASDGWPKRGPNVFICNRDQDEEQIQDALDGYSGTILFSDGNFDFGTEISIPAGRVLQGMGRERTIFTFTAPNTSSAAFKTANGANGAAIKDCSIHRNGSVVPKALLYIYRANRFTGSNLHIEGSGSSPSFGVLIEGVDGVEGSYNAHFDQVYVQAGDNGIGIRSLLQDGSVVGSADWPGSYKCGAHLFTGCVVTGCASAGLHLRAVKAIWMVGCDIENNKYGVDLSEVDGLLYIGWLGGNNPGGGWNIGTNVEHIYTIEPSGNIQDLQEKAAGLIAFSGSNISIQKISFKEDSVVFSPGDAPASPTEGELYYDSVAQKLKVYNGTAWETITSS